MPRAPGATILPDAPPAPPPPGARGDACSEVRPCQDGLACGPLPGGYCVSSCGVTGTPCDAACVETARGGEVCAKACTSDRDCRAEEGYACDPQWRACLIPSIAAIVPAICPAGGAPARDPAFGPSDAWSHAGSPGRYQFEPSAVVHDDGGVTALFIGRGAMSEGNSLAVSRIDARGVRTIGTPLSSSRKNHFDPWLARDRKGTLYAVWLGWDTQINNQEIAMATSADQGATWSEPFAVHDPADCPAGVRDCIDKPMVAVGPDPTRPERDLVYVLYAAGDHGLRVRASADGGKTWGATTTALAGIYGTVATGADGRLHVTTLDGGPLGGYGSAHHEVEYAVSRDGGKTFATPVAVSARDEVLPFFFSNPAIAVDDRRKWLYVAYVRGGRDAKWDIVIAASRDGEKWKRTKLAGDGCAIHMVPNVALDPVTGTLHVAYYDTAGAPGRFVHASCAPGATKCTVHGAINSEPFALLSTVRHSSKWIGEYQSLLVDARRRVLHAVWSQVVSEAGKPVSRIFHARAKLNK